jgi:diguanylate cyclase (GGDEF)-like protein
VHEKSVTIAVVAPQEPFEFFSDFWEGVWSAAYELAPLGVQVNNILIETLDAGLQAQSLEELLRAVPDVIVLLPVESQQFDALIERHAQRGVPVVTVFNDAPRSRRALFVGPDYRVAGRLAGQMLGSVIPQRSRIAALTGSRTSAHLGQQYEGFREALGTGGSEFILTEYETAEDLLAGDFSYGGLYAGCGESPLLDEVLKLVRKPARAVTFGLTDISKPYLESGALCAVIDSSRYYQGYLAVQKAYECVRAQSIESRWVSIPSAVMLPAHVSAEGLRSSMYVVMETVLRQRTAQLRNYKQELDLVNARLMRTGEIDALSGLLNLRKFEEVLGQAFAGTGDRNTTIALLVFALDDAPGIAGLLGQAAADQAIQSIAGALRAACRPDDIVGRTGDAEFAVMLKGPLSVAQALADRILNCVSEVRMAADPEYVLSVSFAMVWTPMHGRTGGELKTAAQSILRKAEGFQALRKAG